MVNKRIMRDIGVLIENYQNIHIAMLDSEITITLYIKNVKLRLILYKDTYPFKSPKLYVGETEYLELTCIRYPRILDEMKRNYIQCFCCNSILCDWGPTMTFNQIIAEFLQKKREIHSTIILSYTRLICYSKNIYDDNIIRHIHSFF